MVCKGHRCFFFSSRRRHTRCLSDWSSDVCSSDLDGTRAINLDGSARSRLTPPYVHGGIAQTFATTPGTRYRVTFRSEERRVGKGCRCRWSLERQQKQEERRKIRRNPR